jgi:hypothetical protein
MREINKEKIALYAAGIGVVAAMAPLLQRIRRTGGTKWHWHVIYWLVAAAAVGLVPDSIGNEIFSPGGVLVIGTLLPMYHSVVAICTIAEDDDRAMLQYWIASASFSFATEFMDDIRRFLPSAGEHWYEFEFFFNLWLLFPLTDGAGLIYEVFTKRFLAPTAKKLKSRFEGYIGIVLTMVNTSYIYFLWFVFMTFPKGAQRFLVVALGTIYPIAASTVAITTTDTSLDDTMWLTYWATFSLLFVAMDYLENFVGSIPGFYSACALATVYLFLPMFNGADVVFRRVLVPLSGQYENMIIHDAYLVRRGVEKSIKPKDLDRVLQRTAEIFMRTKVKAS